MAPGVVLVVRLVVGLQGDSPHLFPDEIGYAAGARSFVTGTPFALGPAPLYYPLYSLVISPVFALGLSPRGAFSAVMVVNAVLGAATAGAVYAASRAILGASGRAAAWAAVIAGVFPGQLLLTTSIWAENLLPLLVLLWLLALHAFLRRLTRPRASLAAAAGVATSVAHPRAIVVVAATVVLGAGLLAGRRRWGTGVVPGAIVLVVGSVLGYVVGRRLVDVSIGPLYRPSPVSFQEGGALDALLGIGSWDDMTVKAVGAVWYQVAATAGLAALGIAELVRRSAAAVPALRPPSVRPGGGHLHHLTPACLLAVVAGLLVGAAAFLAGSSRADNFFSGRYVDAGMPLVLAAGVTCLWSLDPARRLRWLGGTGAALVLVTSAFVVITPELESPRPFVGDMALGLLGQVGLANGPRALPLAVFGLVVTGVVAVAAVRRPTVGVAIAALVFAALALVARRDGLSEPFALGGSLRSFAEDVAVTVGGSPVGVDLSYANTNDLGMLGYQWFRPDLRVYDIADNAAPRSAWVIGPLRWPRAAELRADLVLLDPSRPVGLYVLPGSEQERLRRLGAVLPPDFPAVLPDRAARSRIDGPPDLHPPDGGSAVLPVTVSHLGTANRWPRFDPAGAGFSQARVRVGARAVRATGDGPAVATYMADLPSDLHPGQQADVVLVIDGSTTRGDRLPPGEYRLVVDLYQVDVGWFAERYRQAPLVVRLVVEDSK